MDFFKHLEEMQQDALEGDWDAFEDRWYEVCVDLCGEEAAQRIADIDLEPYTDEVAEALKEAHRLALENDATAIYFEYDPDNDWQGTFFICPDYAALDDGDDDWACDAVEEREGPSLPVFAKLWPEDASESDETLGRTLYLIARTAGAYALATDQLPGGDNIAITIAFHDQDPILRVRDREEVAVDTDGTSEIDPELIEGQIEE